MPISYLNQAQKDGISSILDNIHATFSRPITLFKINKKTTLSSSSNYNSVYRTNAASNLEEKQSLTINARVRYLKMGEEFFTEQDGSSATSIQGRVILPVGSVKLKVDNNGHLFLKDAKRVELDGKRFIVLSNGKPIGMFQPTQYWEYFLTPTD